MKVIIQWEKHLKFPFLFLLILYFVLKKSDQFILISFFCHIFILCFCLFFILCVLWSWTFQSLFVTSYFLFLMFIRLSLCFTCYLFFSVGCSLLCTISLLLFGCFLLDILLVTRLQDYRQKADNLFQLRLITRISGFWRNKENKPCLILKTTITNLLREA